MHTLLHLASWSIGEGPSCNDSAALRLRFSDFETAVRLRSLKGDPHAIARLRARLWDEGEPVHRLSEDQVLERIYHMFRKGRLHVCGQRPIWSVVDSDRRQETGEPPPEQKVPEKTEKTWIEIELVDDNGEPVAGEKYRIVLPGGTVREGRLDARGRARLDELDPGNCEVSFPDRDGREWHAA